MKTNRRKRNNAVDDLIPVASKPASAAPKVKATAADPFVDGLSKGMRELDGGDIIRPRTAASPAATAKNTDILAGALDTAAPVTRQPVIKPVDLVKGKYTRNAAGKIVPVEASSKLSEPSLVNEKDCFTAGLDEGMKDLPEVKEVRPEGIDFAAEGGKAGGWGENYTLKSTNKGNVDELFQNSRIDSVRNELLNAVNEMHLKNAVNEIYRHGAAIGDGGLADAIRHERSTGLPVGGRSHTLKGIERIRNLENIIKKFSLLGDDLVIAQRLIDEIKNALGGK